MVQNSRPPIDAGAIPKRSESVTAVEHLSSYNLKPPPEPSRNVQQTETTRAAAVPTQIWHARGGGGVVLMGMGQYL